MSRTKYKDLTLDQKKRRQISFSKYHKTIPGFLSRLYKNMRGRVEGIQKKSAHLYQGLPLLARKDFYAFSNNSKVFYNLFKSWEKSGYDQRLTPSIDRVDSSLGYIKTNMRWVTHSENSRLGSLSRWKEAKKNA